MPYKIGLLTFFAKLTPSKVIQIIEVVLTQLYNRYTFPIHTAQIIIDIHSSMSESFSLIREIIVTSIYTTIQIFKILNNEYSSIYKFLY